MANAVNQSRRVTHKMIQYLATPEEGHNMYKMLFAHLITKTHNKFLVTFLLFRNKCDMIRTGHKYGIQLLILLSRWFVKTWYRCLNVHLPTHIYSVVYLHSVILSGPQGAWTNQKKKKKNNLKEWFCLKHKRWLLNLMLHMQSTLKIFCKTEYKIKGTSGIKD